MSEIDYDDCLRPKLLKDYIGQDSIKNSLGVYIDSSKKRNKILDHILVYGPPGLGKTTIANIVANELRCGIKYINAPSIEKGGDLVQVLVSLEEGDVLFIDEIHRLKTSFEEILYSAMEDYFIDILSGQGGGELIKLELNKFTLIGATTKPGSLSNPLRDRFGINQKLEYYSVPDLTQIIKRTASILGYEIEEEASEMIANSSRGTPRVANKILKRCVDFAVVENDDFIDEEVVEKTLRMLKIDKNGMSELDIQVLNLMLNTFKKRPVGIESLAKTLGEDLDTIKEIVEPFLIKNDYILRSPSGRKITDKGERYLIENKEV